MTRTVQERSGLPGNAENGWPPEPPGFLSAYPGYRSTALLDGLQATGFSYLDAGGHVYLDYAGAGLPAQAQLAAHARPVVGDPAFGQPGLRRVDRTNRAGPARGPRALQRAARGVRGHLHPERHRRVPAHRSGLPVRPADPADPDAGQSQLGQRHPGIRPAASCSRPQRITHLGLTPRSAPGDGDANC